MPENNQKKEKQMIAAITPVDTGCAFEDIFYALASTGNHKYISFLDSSLVPNRFSIYSYLAWEPEFVIKSSGIKNEVLDLHTGLKEVVYGHPLKFLEQMLKSNIFGDTGSIYFDDLNINPETATGKKSGINNEQSIGQKVDVDAGKIITPDYRGGFIGYFSYDLKNYIEKLPAKAKKDIKVPVFHLCYYLKYLAFNHQTGRCYLIKNYESFADDA
jgi:anthranilate/para-aminobenzoate synthase component I